MRNNDNLRIHIINVGHGDSILVEFPDYREPGAGGGRKPWFGLVDAGGEDKEVTTKTRDYLNTFLRYRFQGGYDAGDYFFEFICLTHPHSDHLHGMMDVLEGFCRIDLPTAAWPNQFWDSGFRYNTVGYLKILDFLSKKSQVRFMRVSSGTEFHYGDLEVVALAPSVDMRNRYDTYGVHLNDASIVLRFTLGKGVAILGADAHFDTWGKVCEEFPRTEHIMYPTDKKGKPDLRDPNREGIAFLNREDQLDCLLLKVAHHGSKRGTSYEYIEKLSPTRLAITCDRNEEYTGTWKDKFPHPITRLVIGEEIKRFKADSSSIPTIEELGSKVGTSSQQGTMIYRMTHAAHVTRVDLGEDKHDRVTVAMLEAAL
jgi:beta-lactamase superfamily II metal-dependent hydrolase